ncbi:hypothetical protein [Haloarchaeobius salinus]|uniref:hypothetical protein n=1 Tax=Haloarchaeobius salinus TaxID=1198298 RepID=UPI00210F0EA3
MDLVNCTNLTAVDCTVVDPHKHGFLAFGTTGGTISNCRPRNPNARSNNYIIFLTNILTGMVVDGCTVIGGTNTCQGITTDTTPTEIRETECTVRGNFTERSVNWEGVEDSVLDVTVSDNTISEGVLASDPQGSEFRVSAFDILRWGFRMQNSDGTRRVWVPSHDVVVLPMTTSPQPALSLAARTKRRCLTAG